MARLLHLEESLQGALNFLNHGIGQTLAPIWRDALHHAACPFRHAAIRGGKKHTREPSDTPEEFWGALCMHRWPCLLQRPCQLLILGHCTSQRVLRVKHQETNEDTFRRLAHLDFCMTQRNFSNLS